MRSHIENLYRTVTAEGKWVAWQRVRFLLGWGVWVFFETSTGPLCNPKAVPGCTFWPHEFVFLSVQ